LYLNKFVCTSIDIFLLFSVLRLAKRFQCNHEEDQLLDEYLDYQLTPNEELPNFSPDETRLDTYWLEMEGMSLLDGQKRFKNLPVVALEGPFTSQQQC
jgi:hypothetical protein